MTTLLKYLIAILVALPLIAQCQPLADEDSRIAGMYVGGSGLLVSYIYIKPDLTFEFRLYGDLYNGNGCTGQLTPLGANFFLANSISLYSPPNQRDVFNTGRDSISITFIDAENISPIALVNVRVECKSDTLTGSADKNGQFKLVNSLLQKISAFFPGYKRIEDTIHDHSLLGDSIVYRLSEVNFGYIKLENERWLIQNDSLIKTLDDTLNYNYVLKKSAFPSSNEPYFANSDNGNYVIEMIPTHAYGNKGTGNVYRIIEGEKRQLLWSVGWFAQNVSIANDGLHLIRLEPWGSDVEQFSDVALEFYRKNHLLKRYKSKEILGDTSTVTKDIGHYRHTAYKSSIPIGLSNENKTFTLVQTDKSVNVFDILSGHLIDKSFDALAFRNRTELNAHKSNQSKMLSLKLLKQTPALQAFQKDFRITDIRFVGGSIAGLHLNENRKWKDAFKDWKGTFVPHKEYSVPIEANIIFATSDDQTVHVDLQPMQIIYAMDEITLTDPGFDSLDISGIRMRAAGNRLHWESKEVREYMQLLERYNEPSAPLDSWVFFIVDTPRGSVSFYHPMGSDIYICNTGLLNVDYWKSLYLQKLNVVDSSEKVYYQPLKTYCLVLDNKGNMRFLQAK
ncbi:MAG: hypothetical protein ACRBF0_01360 [Calditrichia bacterium]